MGWSQRLREAAYTSPSGERLTFDYERVSRETTKRSHPFEFVGINDAYVQDNGYGPRSYPLRCIFWGDDHDLEATAFEQALLEPGVGRLEHPLYGPFDAVPTGTIRRREDLKEEANQTIIEVEFLTTTGVVYPSPQTDARTELGTALTNFSTAVSEQFSNSVSLDRAGARTVLKTTVQAHLVKATAALSGIAEADTTALAAFRDASDALNYSLDVTVGTPLVIGQQTVDVLMAPSRSTASIADRLDAFGTFAQSIYDSPQGNPDDVVGLHLARTEENATNDFVTSDLNAASAIAAMVQSLLETTFSSKPEALTAASTLLDQWDAFVAWREVGYAALGLNDTGETYQALQDAVSLGAGFLVEISFTLVPERSITLDRARTLIDLAAELYGAIDEHLDDLINHNELTGDEILELPRGRTLVYYA